MLLLAGHKRRVVSSYGFVVFWAMEYMGTVGASMVVPETRRAFVALMLTASCAVLAASVEHATVKVIGVEV